LLSEELPVFRTYAHALRGLVALFTGAYALGLLVFLMLRLIWGDTLWWLAFLGNFTPFYFAALLVLFPLALIVRAKRSPLLMLPLVVLGILWFGRLYLPKAQAQAGDAPTLRVISFNVWGDNPNMTDVEDWLREMDADVVLTQEAPPAWAGETVNAMLAVYPHQANMSVDTRYWGNNTWSRLPILSVENFDLEGDGTPSQSRVVIEVDGQQVAVYNIHLLVPMSETPRFSTRFNFSYLGMLLKYDDSARNAQIERLIERLKSEVLPYIVAGDFNLSDQTGVYNDLAAVMRDSFREAGTGLGTSWPNVQRMGLPSVIPPLVRIDYIWHSDEFRAISAAQGPYLGSDHLPVYATLALGQRGLFLRNSR
jgi:vancomycin resistance protein VanJ